MNEKAQFAERHEEFSKFHIDLTRLEEEWVNQPEMVERVSDKYVIAKKDCAIAEDNQELVEAQLKMKVMRDPQKFGLDKPTVDAIKATVQVQPQYREARLAVIEATYRVDKYKADLNTLEHRKKGLEKLVDLWTQSYFSTPRIGRTIHKDQAFSHKPVKAE